MLISGVNLIGIVNSPSFLIGSLKVIQVRRKSLFSKVVKFSAIVELLTEPYN